MNLFRRLEQWRRNQIAVTTSSLKNIEAPDLRCWHPQARSEMRQRL